MNTLVILYSRYIYNLTHKVFTLTLILFINSKATPSIKIKIYGFFWRSYSNLGI